MHVNSVLMSSRRRFNRLIVCKALSIRSTECLRVLKSPTAASAAAAVLSCSSQYFPSGCKGKKKSFQNAPQYRRLSQQDERFRLNQIPKCFAIQKAPRLKLKPKANCDCDFALIRKQSEALRALISQRIFISCSLAGAR
jgi:hypothetical protein